jgi:hypothetical protein
VAQQLEALEHEAHLACAHAGRAASSSSGEQVLAVQPHRAALGTSSPAMMDSSVLLPEPEAPTMATDSRAARLKWMSRRMSACRWNR